MNENVEQSPEFLPEKYILIRAIRTLLNATTPTPEDANEVLRQMNTFYLSYNKHLELNSKKENVEGRQQDINRIKTQLHNAIVTTPQVQINREGVSSAYKTLQAILR